MSEHSSLYIKQQLQDTRSEEREHPAKGGYYADRSLNAKYSALLIFTGSDSLLARLKFWAIMRAFDACQNHLARSR